mmetsp:Transcript_46914/g.106375  ORF Transcript_46914/g.106375 Transcript_46914/m.106375 type:complete len:535 (-) Transcript_46914:104-1708(-)
MKGDYFALPEEERNSGSTRDEAPERDYTAFEDYQKDLRQQNENGKVRFEKCSSEPLLVKDDPTILTASDIAKPGGFRRWLLATQKQEGDSPSAALTDHETKKLTKSIKNNFLGLVEFLDLADSQWGPEDLFDDLGPGLFREPSAGALRYKPEKLQGTGKTCASIFKAFVGAGILFLPNAYHNSGWAGGTIMMVASAVVSTIGICKLGDCHALAPGSYPELGRAAFGTWGYWVIALQIAFSQYCFGTTHMIFITSTLQAALTPYNLMPSMVVVYLALTAIYIPLSWVRRLHNMKITNALGSLIQIVCIVFVAFCAMQVLHEDALHTAVVAFDKHRWVSFLGTSVFAFEGIACVLPIREAMARPETFNGVVSGMIVVLAMMLIGFGVVCYLAWGPGVAAVALNAPEASFGVRLAQALYVVAVFCTYPIVMYPTFAICEGQVFHRVPFSLKRKWLKNLLRTCIVLSQLALAAVAASDVEMFVALIGAVCSVPLSFLFPAVMHMKMVKKGYCSSIFILVIGILVMPVTIWQAAAMWGT